MADPVSIVATVSGLLDITLRASKLLRNTYTELKSAPVLIFALANEAADIAVVLTQIRDAVEELGEEKGVQENSLQPQLRSALSKAASILDDLGALAFMLSGESTTTQRVKWLLKKGQAATLQARLRDVRTRITELLLTHTR